MPKVSLFFKWYDLWIGAYIDTRNRTIYIMPIPMVGIKIKFRRRSDHDANRRYTS